MKCSKCHKEKDQVMLTIGLAHMLLAKDQRIELDGATISEITRFKTTGDVEAGMICKSCINKRRSKDIIGLILTIAIGIFSTVLFIEYYEKMGVGLWAPYSLIAIFFIMLLTIYTLGCISSNKNIANDIMCKTAMKNLPKGLRDPRFIKFLSENEIKAFRLKDNEQSTT